MMTFYQLLDWSNETSVTNLILNPLAYTPYAYVYVPNPILCVEAFLLHVNDLGRVYFLNRMYTCMKTRNDNVYQHWIWKENFAFDYKHNLT